jgi:hypothetical protein
MPDVERTLRLAYELRDKRIAEDLRALACGMRYDEKQAEDGAIELHLSGRQKRLIELAETLETYLEPQAAATMLHLDPREGK